MQTFKQFFFESTDEEIIAFLYDDRSYDGKTRISNYDPLTGKIDKHKIIKVDSNRLLHSDEGPAYRRLSYTGILFEEIWAKHGKRHRLDGPAQTRWDYMSNKYLEQYFINGQSYSKEEFDEYVKGLNNKEDKELLGDLGQTFE